MGAYAAAIGGLDCVVFTAGIGENSPTVRRLVCEGLDFLGIDLDLVENEKQRQGPIGRGRVAVLVIPTDEELAIAHEVESVLAAEPPVESGRTSRRIEASGKTILTIDDDPDFQLTLKILLEDAEYGCGQTTTMRTV